MIFFEEEYYIDARKSNEFRELIEEFEQAVKDSDLPYLIDWYFLSERYEIGHVRNVWILEAQEFVDVLWDAFPPPELEYLVTKVFEYLIPGTYRYSFWKKVASK